MKLAKIKGGPVQIINTFDKRYTRPFSFRSTTYARYSLHDEEFPRTHPPPEKKSTEVMIVIEEQLMSIVRVGPCQVFADVERNEGVIVYNTTAQSQFDL